MASTTQFTASEHPIKSVTVFKSSKAEVVRVFNSLSLQQGRNTIEISGLPSSIDSQSIRVSGLGDGRLLDVVCTIGTPKSEEHAPSISGETLRTLEVDKAALESEKRVREHEADLLVTYAKTLNGEHVTPVQMTQFLGTFVDHGQKNLKAVRAIGEKIIEVDRLIAAERNKTTSKKGAAHGQVTVVVGSESEASIDLKLTYIVGNAHWRSAYELHATTEEGKPSPAVTLHYLARITQSTGEDWTDAALTLNTVSSDTSSKSIPRLFPVKITPRGKGLFGSKPGGSRQVGAPQQQQQQRRQQQQQQQLAPVAPSLFGQNPAPAPTTTLGAFGQNSSTLANQQNPAPASGNAFGPFGSTAGGSTFGAQNTEEEGFEEVSAPGDTEPEPKTIVTETPVAISYSVHGGSTIPSDGIEHQATVAVLQFESTISHITIPRVDPRLYLQCNVKNTSEYRLLPGFVSVILDDSYVSKTTIQAVNPGDTFDCTLGDDVSTRVTYSRIPSVVRATGGAFAELFTTTTYTTHITIENKHPFAISDLRVRDVIPTCEDRRIKVILVTPDRLANATEGQEVSVKDGLVVMWHQEKEGMFEWRWKVESGEMVTIEAKWEVRAPADIAWTDQLARGDF